MGKILYADKETIYQNPQIPANQKVQSGDMNSIKNAINQEGRYTPTTYNSANGQFTCQMVGNLEVGDTIQVILDLTSQDENEYYNISISIDDGATYYDLVDTKKGFVLNGSDFEYLEIYLKAVFNGTSFVLISPDRVTNEITLRLSGVYSAPSGLNYYYVDTLTEIYEQVGQRLGIGTVTPSGSGSNMSGVKIGEGITKIEATGQMQLTNTNTTSAMYFTNFIQRIKPDGSAVQISRSLNYDVLASGSQTANMATSLQKVEQNDIIGLRLYKSIASGTCTVDIDARTYVTVKEVR